MSARRAIALLDLHARDDQFQDDASFGALAARLQEAGHRVSLVRSVLSTEPGGKDAWHARLGAFLREGSFELALLARVWDEATIAVIREAIGTEGKVVRLTSGVAAALDTKLDHVLDLGGLERLLAGDESPDQAAFRRVKPAELRQRAASAPSRLLVMEAAALPGEASENVGRPTISGPASGCPFLLDAGKSPIFKDLGADPQKVQMKGCTFCLDNTGAFATPTEEAVIGAWLSQLRKIKERSPHAREILLTDERPHPYLPAFFRALLAEPSLGPVELLFKSRVDWLLEFADGPVAEALALAEQGGNVLHLYLIGFESFDPFHLELFNKGCTVDDNIRAIDKARELAARFPRSFEHLRYRAHGIVLFTPWTTPESLLENARRMREVRFHELRAEAIRTRLRLYPRVPLHALAEKEGLLVDAFDPARPDRAAEQGYDASVPWRFKDPRTEAVYRAATELARTDRSMADADVLEIVARVVIRHPGLAAVPDLAILPVRQALRSWGGAGPAALDGLDAAMLSFDPEIELLFLGKKRACLKEAVSAAEAEDLGRAYRAMGLSAAIVERHGFVEGEDAHARGADYAILAVAADDEALAAVLDAQRAHGSVKGTAAVRVMGDLMGYPRCCVSSFVEQRTRGDNLDNERLTFRRAPDEALHPYLHRTGGVRLLSHHPCTPSCPGSIAIGEAIVGALKTIDGEASARALDKLSRPVLFLDYQRRIELSGGWEGGRFRVERAIVLDDPRHLGFDAASIAAIELSREGATLSLRNGTRQMVRAPSPLLTTPGAPLHPLALAAIGGKLAPAARPAAREESPMHTAAESTGAHDIASTQEQNRRIIEAMVSASGLRKLPRARLAVEAVEAVVQEAAVDLVLGIGGRSFRLRFSNRDDKTPALEKTPSFNAVHIAGQGDKQLDGPSATTLIWAVQRLSRFDSGKLRFTQPPRVRARGALLPVVKGDDLADRVWKRAIFDRSMETLKAKGVQVPSIVAVVSQACEMNCQFCPTTDRVNIHFQPSGESGQLGDLIYQVRRGRELGATAIDFGSNDALLFPGILDVFRAARDAGYTMVMAQSPGQALADRAFAEAAAESGLTHVALPIYGTTAEVHDAITRKPGTFDGLMKALQNLREIGLPHVQLHTIALKSTLPLLEGLIAFCRDELGLPVRVSTLRSNRQGERAVVLDMASFSELKPLIAEHPKLFQAEFPPCLFPRARTKAFLESFPRETPPAPINLYDLGLPDGCEDALVALERKPQYPARCAPCQAKFGCSGVLGHYLDVFGDEELDPFLEIGPYKPFSEEE